MKIEELKNKTVTVFAFDEVYEATIHLSKYGHGGRPRIDLILDDGEPLATLTVNVPEATVQEDEIIVKTWAENEGTAKSVMRTGWFEDTGRRVPTGHVEAEVWRLK